MKNASYWAASHSEMTSAARSRDVYKRQEVDGSAVYGSTLDPIYDRVQIHVNAFGGHFVNPDDPTDCVLDEPPAVAALEWLRVRFQDDGVMASPLALNKLETRRAFWEAVSYTHLDVYKRQPCRSTPTKSPPTSSPPPPSTPPPPPRSPTTW